MHLEEARSLVIHDTYDVVIAGGGPAGIGAALGAARAGARVVILEVAGCLGGIWTNGLLSYIIDAESKSGVIDELLRELRSRDAMRGRAYDPEIMKVVLEEKMAKAGVTILYHTRVVAAARNKNNRLAVTITESKSGREAWAAKAFVDCTGDGDLAAQAGCGFAMGSDGSGEVQPLSLMCLLTGIDSAEQPPFNISGHAANTAWMRTEIQRGGVDPSYAHPTMIFIRPGLVAMMANHEYEVLATDARALTVATLRARAEVHQIVNALRSLKGAWEHLRIVATAAQIGVREGRRIAGHYTVTRDDLIAGREHADAVCRVTYMADVHSTNPKKAKGYSTHGISVKPYDIPLRALIARDVDGLLLAGRCISGDFFAHASYRVTGNAVALGQAAGVTAALAAASGHRPQDIEFGQVREALNKQMTIDNN